jgi:hypothetical protein
MNSGESINHGPRGAPLVEESESSKFCERSHALIAKIFKVGSLLPTADLQTIEGQSPR